jgi:hypothetical protein
VTTRPARTTKRAPRCSTECDRGRPLASAAFAGGGLQARRGQLGGRSRRRRRGRHRPHDGARIAADSSRRSVSDGRPSMPRAGADQRPVRAPGIGRGNGQHRGCGGGHPGRTRRRLTCTVTHSGRSRRRQPPWRASDHLPEKRAGRHGDSAGACCVVMTAGECRLEGDHDSQGPAAPVGCRNATTNRRRARGQGVERM